MQNGMESNDIYLGYVLCPWQLTFALFSIGQCSIVHVSRFLKAEERRLWNKWGIERLNYPREKVAYWLGTA